MLIWFIVATVLLGSIFIYAFREDDNELIFPALMLYVLFAFFPSFVHTARTDVYPAAESEYRIYITSQYSALLLTDIQASEPDAKKVTNAYLLYKIQLGEYKVVKHVNRNMWKSESAAPVEYFVLAK